MVLSIKAAAPAGYYYQKCGLEAVPRLAGGVWLSGHKALGVETRQTVALRDLAALLAREVARTGERATLGRKKGSCGSDFVFSMPKSVSIAWALDRDARRDIEDAQEAAVERAAELLADKTIRERRGEGGQILGRAVPAIAAFFHVKSRPALHIPRAGDTGAAMEFPDPNLHTHVIVSDLVVSCAPDPDSKDEPRLKIAYTALYRRWSMALGAWYHASLAFELRSRGFELQASGTNGLFQLAGSDPRAVAAFSARAEGVRDPGRFKAAALADGKARQPAMDGAALEELWRAWAVRCGMRSPFRAARPAGDLNRARPPFDAKTVFADVARDLSQNEAVLQEQDFHRGVVCALVAHGALRPPVGDMVEEVLSLGDVEPLRPTASYALAQ